MEDSSYPQGQPHVYFHILCCTGSAFVSTTLAFSVYAFETPLLKDTSDNWSISSHCLFRLPSLSVTFKAADHDLLEAFPSVTSMSFSHFYFSSLSMTFLLLTALLLALKCPSRIFLGFIFFFSYQKFHLLQLFQLVFFLLMTHIQNMSKLYSYIHGQNSGSVFS